MVPMQQMTTSSKSDLRPVDVRNNLSQQELNELYYQFVAQLNNGHGEMHFHPGSLSTDGRIVVRLKLQPPSSTNTKLYNCALHRTVTAQIDHSKLNLDVHRFMLAEGVYSRRVHQKVMSGDSKEADITKIVQEGNLE